MQLQQLAYFLAVAETRHFTRAAELSRVAQPSLSKQIKALEEELGAPLFVRARGNITLTPAGEILLPLAQRILADVETARREIQELAGMRRGWVRLGATPSLCAGLLADASSDSTNATRESNCTWKRAAPATSSAPSAVANSTSP